MILVTGATGKVEREVLRRLLAKGLPVRVLTRDRAAAGLPDGVEVVEGDLEQPEALAASLDGAEKMFFMAPTERLHLQAERLAAAIPASRLDQIVLLSSLSVEMSGDEPLRLNHVAAEEALKASGRGWTMLRGGVFASNTLAWSKTIKAESMVHNMLVDDAYAPIDPVDIGAVAAVALTEPGHEGKVYGLTGEESIRPSQQTAILGELLGREIGYSELPFEEAASLFQRFTGEGAATLRMLRQPDTPWARPRPDVRVVTGAAPRTYRQWAQANLDLFR